MKTRSTPSLALWLGCWACADARVRATTCSATGAVAPAVNTLMALNGQAVVVTTSCTTTTIATTTNLNGVVRLSQPSFMDVERISSIPENVQWLEVSSTTLTQGADLSQASQLRTFDYWVSSTTTIDNIVFPDSLATINIYNSAFSTAKNVKWPRSVTSLRLGSNRYTAIDFVIPETLLSLGFDASPITALERTTFPNSITSLDFNTCAVTTIRGCKFPSSLSTLTLGQTAITMFEIRESDFQVFSKLTKYDANVVQTKCTDASATLTSSRFCVISDDRFEELYGAAATSTPTVTISSSSTTTTGTKGPASSASSGTGTSGTNSPQTEASSSSTQTDSDGLISGSHPGEDGASTASTGETSSTTATGNAGSTGGNLQGSGNSSASESLVPGSSRKPGASSDTNESTGASSSPSSSLVLVLAVVGSGIVLAVAFVAYRVFVQRKHRQQDEDGTFFAVTEAKCLTGSSGSSSLHTADSQEFLSNDVRNDPLLVALRLDERDVVLGNVIARGGFGIIYQAVYRSQLVAVKQMLPGTWRDQDGLRRFMDEIRLCASLQHPKIVSFVGITWSSLVDLSAVIEYMPGGDLQAVLQNQPGSSAVDWTQPWADTRIKSKTLIAVDIVEAVVYLHLRSNPILHRDLKARNVLLDEKGNAKLSDFGISREIPIDQTMTSEIGTAAWIAPEVLRGERYSEKADIYSLGVLLVELDRCRHPYTGRDGLLEEEGESKTNFGVKNARIAVHVSTGRLRPSVSDECPATIRVLVDSCLQFDAVARPSAREVLVGLQSTMDAEKAIKLGR